MAKKRAKAVKAKVLKKTKSSSTKKPARSLALKSPDRVPQRCKDVLHRKNTDGTYAIMRLDNDQFFFVLDGMAAEFWAGIDGRTSVESIKKSLVSKYNPPAKAFDRDVSTLLKQLEKEQLVSLAQRKK